MATESRSQIDAVVANNTAFNSINSSNAWMVDQLVNFRVEDKFTNQPSPVTSKSVKVRIRVLV